MEDLDDSFIEDSGELIALDTLAIMSDKVVNAIRTVLQVYRSDALSTCMQYAV